MIFVVTDLNVVLLCVQAKWKSFLLNGEPVATEEAASEDGDRDYVPPVGLDHYMEEKRIKEIPRKIAEAVQLVDKLKIEQDVSVELKKLAGEGNFDELLARIENVNEALDGPKELAKIKDRMSELNIKMHKLKIPVKITEVTEKVIYLTLNH